MFPLPRNPPPGIGSSLGDMAFVIATSSPTPFRLEGGPLGGGVCSCGGRRCNRQTVMMRQLKVSSVRSLRYIPYAAASTSAVRRDEQGTSQIKGESSPFRTTLREPRARLRGAGARGSLLLSTRPSPSWREGPCQCCFPTGAEWCTYRGP